jgi:hypothetical protein
VKRSVKLFGCVWQDLDDPSGRPERIAKQILVEYGEHVKKKQVKQPKKPKKNAELVELKVRLKCQDLNVRNFRATLVINRLKATRPDSVRNTFNAQWGKLLPHHGKSA